MPDLDRSRAARNGLDDVRRDAGLAVEAMPDIAPGYEWYRELADDAVPDPGVPGWPEARR